MERLTHEADFGLECWEETLFFVKSDPNGAYNIIDIARYQGDSEFDEILKNISLRLAALENILGDDYNLDRLRELVQADREGRYIIMRDAERNGVARLKELSEADREGRCVILPVKPGETVRFNGNPMSKPEVVDAITIYANGRITYNFHTTGMMTRYVDEWDEDDVDKYYPVNDAMKERKNDG